MLEPSNFARSYTPICSFRKYTVQCLRPLNFVDISIFWQKISVFCPKKHLYSKHQCERCGRDLLVLVSVFVTQKVPSAVTFADSVSGIRPPYCSKLAKNRKDDNDVIIFRHDVNVTFFDVVLFLLSSIVTAPSFMSISSLVLEL